MYMYDISIYNQIYVCIKFCVVRFDIYSFRKIYVLLLVTRYNEK